jgi:outer membrane protein assembly factor BamD (BamD/ComL family)
MTWRRLPVLLLVAGCAGGPTPAPNVATPPDDTDRLVRLAEMQVRAGSHAEAARTFEEVTRDPSSAFADRALLGLTRVLCDPEYAGRDYQQAYLVADRLVQEYPTSHYVAEARAWRDLIVAYLALGQELERRADRLQRLDLELERRTLELERRTQELERLKRLDLELEQQKRKP